MRIVIWVSWCFAIKYCEFLGKLCKLWVTIIVTSIKKSRTNRDIDWRDASSCMDKRGRALNVDLHPVGSFMKANHGSTTPTPGGWVNRLGGQVSHTEPRMAIAVWTVWSSYKHVINLTDGRSLKSESYWSRFEMFGYHINIINLKYIYGITAHRN